MSQALIHQYLAELSRLKQASGSSRETIVREAFKDLLKAWGRPHDLVFVAEYPMKTATKANTTVDGEYEEFHNLCFVDKLDNVGLHTAAHGTTADLFGSGSEENVAADEKIPRKDGPGITKSDLFVINKVDLAPCVGADLSVMEADTRRMRPDHAGARPHVTTNLKTQTGLAEVVAFIERRGLLVG